jgi:monofunctional biosynthetic peptidoglycan transglycosylase
MLKKILRFIFKVFVGFILLSVLSVILFRFVPIPFTPLMLIRCVQQAANGKHMVIYKSWQPISRISPHLQLAVVASEDQNFLSHMGFDVKAIQTDMEYNKTHKIKRGASTISQQTAKNVFLWPSRSFIRKGFEVYFTFLIELFWSKERIMEVYLNVIEMGDGVYGAEAASQYYFKRHASDLTSYQAACIGSIVPDPIKWKLTNPPGFVVARQNWILQQMSNLGGTLNYDQKEVPQSTKSGR